MVEVTVCVGDEVLAAIDAKADRIGSSNTPWRFSTQSTAANSEQLGWVGLCLSRPEGPQVSIGLPTAMNFEQCATSSP